MQAVSYCHNYEKVTELADYNDKIAIHYIHPQIVIITKFVHK
jgi:hypothetical protein